MEMRKGSRTALLALAGALALVLVPASVASAHADYRGSDPADGETVSSPPTSVTAEFTEPPADGSSLQIFDPCGQRVDAGDYRYQGMPFNTVTVSMSADKAGEYEAVWTVVSAADAHTTRGRFNFSSSGGGPCPGTEGGKDEKAESDDGQASSSGDGASDPSQSGPVSAAGDAGSQDDENDGKRQKKKNKAKDATERTETPASEQIELTQSEVPGEESPTEDLPLDWLIVGLSISALIGAAAGRIYAGIRGPRSK